MIPVPVVAAKSTRNVAVLDGATPRSQRGERCLRRDASHHPLCRPDARRFPTAVRQCSSHVLSCIQRRELNASTEAATTGPMHHDCGRKLDVTSPLQLALLLSCFYLDVDPWWRSEAAKHERKTRETLAHTLATLLLDSYIYRRNKSRKGSKMFGYLDSSTFKNWLTEMFVSCCFAPLGQSI